MPDTTQYCTKTTFQCLLYILAFLAEHKNNNIQSLHHLAEYCHYYQKLITVSCFCNYLLWFQFLE